MSAPPPLRSFSSASVLAFLLSALSVLWVLIIISPQTYRPLMLLIGVWASLRLKPLPGRWGAVADLLWVIAALVGLGWPLAQGEAFWYRAATPTGGDLLAGVLALLVVTEATRRMTGWALPIVTVVFLMYAVAGPWLVSMGLTGLAHRGYDLPRLIGSLYMSLEGIYGVPLDVAVTYITLFSLYGAVLEASGAGTFFLKWSLSMAGGARSAASTGRSVSLAGFLLGTVSGSGVATTVTLGSMAWPLLKRAGFAANTAGAMLAASGIGAILSPPTLGAAAFLIAEYLRISYLQVLIMATVPTVLYYASITLMIEGDAPSLPAPTAPASATPAVRFSSPQSQSDSPHSNNRRSSILNPQSSITQYLHFSSLVLVAALMALGFTPFRAVFWAIVAAVVVSVAVRQPLGPRRLAGAFTAGGTDALSVLSTTAVAGIIVGIVTLTGLGLKAAGLIVAMAGGSVILTVFWSAIAVWILGLAVPVTASYIIAAVMVVPALTSVGVAPVAAHMFVFYYAVLSEVSPPTALAPFAAAALTGGQPFRTMMLTWKYSLPAFLVPIAFTLDPRGVGLLLQGSWVDMLVGFVTALAGTAALAAALTGAWGFSTRTARGLMAVAGLLLFHPAPWADVAGILALVGARLAVSRGPGGPWSAIVPGMSRRPIPSILMGAALLVAGLSTPVAPVAAQQATPVVLSSVTTPKAQFGHDIGADYVLPNYTQFEAYWRKLDGESDRLVLTEIGKTAEGRPQLMMIITSPENHRRLDRYREISRRLALAEGLTDAQAQALAKEGKAVVWIDGGLHSTETLGAQQLMETVYQLASRTDDETMRILNDVIILAVHANPDGMELVSNWYMRNPVPEERSTANLPELYQKYAGHDNNRDFYMAALPESENMNRILYREWMPQIVYNHHQTGPAGTVMFAPPFRDPFNHNFHPMIPATLDLVGSAMATRFLAEGKPGVTSRQGANYSTWWNGGLRTTPYFHNMIGILTETIGGPNPTSIPFVLGRQLPSSSLWSPIAPQRWHFRQSVDYSLTANYAILDLASRYRETFLLNIFQMGRDNIQRGNQDSWTPSPRRVAAVQAKMAEVGGTGRGGRAGGAAGAAGGGRGGAATSDVRGPYWNDLHAPEHRDPRGFILSADQPDFGTATRFMNALIKGGVTVHRATAAFSVNGKQYPANSYVVKAAQAFRPHVMDMFQPQDHPDDFPYEGGPPNRPYDSAGYTLAMQMGVEFDPILEAFDGPFERVADMAATPPGRIIGTQQATGYYFSHGSNDSLIAVNRLLKAGETVTWLADGPMGTGTFHVQAKPTTRALLERMAAELGVSFQIATTAPTGPSTVLRAPRIGLFDQYGGGMPSGWTRLVFENFEFPYTVVYPPMLDAGNLRETFDILIFNGSGIPGLGAGGGGRGGGGGAAADIPAEFRERQGSVTAATMAKIKEFVEGGGTLLTIGGASTNIAAHFDLPIQNHLTERNDAGVMTSIPATKFYVPGSVLRAKVDAAASITHGLPEELNVYFNNSPTFRLGPNATSGRIRTIAWFHTPTPLRSGWAWGQSYLQDGIAAYEAEVGKGRLFVFGPEITFRSQPHGTFKFLFNGILLSATEGLR